MKIVIISHYRLPHKGGIEYVIHQLGRRFSADGHEVVCISSGTNASSLKKDGITYVDVPAWNPFERFGIPYPLFAPLALLGTVRSALKDADVLHVHGLLYMSGIVGILLAKRRGIRIVVSEYVGFVSYGNRLVNLVERVAFSTLGRFSARRADAIVVSNTEVQEEMVQLALPDTPVVKIINGVDTAFFHPVSLLEKEALRSKRGAHGPVVLFVGRLVQKKGIDIVLEAADSAFEIWVCSQNRLSNPSNFVRSVGPVEPEELRELYQTADIFVLPSEGEGFPLAVQEALACGLPVIITDNAINHEYLDETVALFIQRSPVALRSALFQLINDPARRIQMSQAARGWALDHFSWEHTQSAYLSLYRVIRERQDVEHGIAAQSVGNDPAE